MTDSVGGAAERPAEPPKQGWYDTDDAPPRDVLAMVRLCAASWVPEARLLGNVRAGDIVRALDDLLRPAASQVGEPREPPEPSEEAIREAERVWRYSDEQSTANKMREALAAAYRVDFPVRAGAPPTERPATIEQEIEAAGFTIKRFTIADVEREPERFEIRPDGEIVLRALSGGGPPHERER